MKFVPPVLEYKAEPLATHALVAGWADTIFRRHHHVVCGAKNGSQPCTWTAFRSTLRHCQWSSPLKAPPGPRRAAARAARAGSGARPALRRRRHAHRLRAAGLLPPGQRGDRARAGGRGMRRHHPGGPGLLRRAVAARRPPGGGRRFARRTIETFERAGVDAIVVNVAGCGSAMKEYARTAGRRPRLERAGRGAGRQGPRPQRVPGRTRPGRAPRTRSTSPWPTTTPVTWPTPSGSRRSRASCWRAIPGLRLAAIADGGTCCGSAGIYNLVQPEPARELGERKATAVAGTGADLLVTGNPGCAMQITAALAARGTRCRRPTSPRCSTRPSAASAGRPR